MESNNKYLLYECFNDISEELGYHINKFNLGISDLLTEMTEEYSNDTIITEKVKESFFSRVKKWFKNLILNFTNFANSIKINITSKKRDSDFGKSLRKMQEELIEKKKKGYIEVQVSDIWTIRDLYIEAVDSLTSQYRKLFKDRGLLFRKSTDDSDNVKSRNKVGNKYKYIEQVDKQLEQIDSAVKYWDEKLKAVSEKTVVKNIDDMLRFIDKEISNRSEVMKTLNNAMTMLDELLAEIDYMEKKIEIYGSDVLCGKRVFFLKKIASNITSFIRRWIGKAIANIVFIFA